MFSNSSGIAQGFVNGDLNGVVQTSVAPTNWLQIPFTDPVSLSTFAPGGTSDVTSMTGPAAFAGINGNPYSGTTFVTGLHASDGTDFWHEGIMQTLNGLSPGTTYTIHFYQAVVKQSNCLDPSGSWMVAMDNTQIGVTAPTFSAAIFNSTSFIWESRSLSFTATATSHMIKFLPLDDDPNILCINGTDGLRMGIDSITLSIATVLNDSQVELELSEIGGEVELRWDSPDSGLYDEFILERSADGIHFEPIEAFPGDLSFGYIFLDRNPYRETWYRLEQRKQNGGLEYSEIKSIILDNELDFGMEGTELKLSGHDQKPYQIIVSDLRGTEVFSGLITESFDLGNVSPGAYVVQLWDHGNSMHRISKKIAIFPSR